MTKNLTAATVSRILAKRHTRSISRGSQVRGYRAESEGFRVTGSGVVTVKHVSDRVYRKGDEAVEREALNNYADTLRSAGLHVELVAPVGISAQWLRVTRAER